MARANGLGSTTALVSACALAAAAPAVAASNYAIVWLQYSPGAGVPLAYQNANNALGEPCRYTGDGVDPGVVSPFHPAFMPNDVVSIGPGGSLIVSFEVDVLDNPANPFGIDLIVFGNSFFTDLDAPNGVCGTLFAEGGIIDVSTNGVQWFEVPGVAADGAFPTLGYLDVDPYSIRPGAVPSSFTKPVDPAALDQIEEGMGWQELHQLYDGSGGGTGIDLASVGLTKARFVRVRVPAESQSIIEIDGFARVSPGPVFGSPADLNGDGFVDGDDLGTLLGAWGSDGALPDGGSADLDSNGVVDGGDLGSLLGDWS
ncbi:MAG: hypothetical protein FJ253_08605 [Phycisphaerae bacterium]|nr:hypothetical protein [Phycisphaerae bacterium]